MTSPFTIKTLRFLRALKRNNDREWFRARKAQYEADVRQPMIALIERLAADFKSFAPEFVAEPKVSLYRIYRDTRFSADKTPLKTHAAAHFPMRGMPKGEGGGLYFEIAPAWVWIGGGLYMPSNPQLHVIRAHIAASHPRFHRLVTAPAFRRTVGTLEGERLSRVPRGYDRDHPAAHYLQFKQFLAGREFAGGVCDEPHMLQRASGNLPRRRADGQVSQRRPARGGHYASAGTAVPSASARSVANRRASSGASADVVTRIPGPALQTESLTGRYRPASTRELLDDIRLVAHRNPDVESGCGCDLGAGRRQRRDHPLATTGVGVGGTCEMASARGVGPEGQRQVLEEMAHPSRTN